MAGKDSMINGEVQTSWKFKRSSELVPRMRVFSFFSLSSQLARVAVNKCVLAFHSFL